MCLHLQQAVMLEIWFGFPFAYQTEPRSPAKLDLDQLWDKCYWLLNYSVMLYFSIHHNILGSKTSILQWNNFRAIEKRKAFSLLSNLKDEVVFTLSSFIYQQKWFMWHEIILNNIIYPTSGSLKSPCNYSYNLLIFLPTCCIKLQHFRHLCRTIDSFSGVQPHLY